MKILICAGATFVARTHASQVNHMIQMIERAMDHQGFSLIESRPRGRCEMDAAPQGVSCWVAANQCQLHD